MDRTTWFVIDSKEGGRRHSSGCRGEPVAAAGDRSVVIAPLSVLGNGIAEPLIDQMHGEGMDRRDAFNEVARKVLNAAPAIALIWAL